MVLFLFVMMLLNVEEKEGRLSVHVGIQLLTVFMVGLLLVGVVGLYRIGVPVPQLGERAAEFGTTRAVGMLLFTEYLLPFEIASVLLLAAIVGAVILAKRRID